MVIGYLKKRATLRVGYSVDGIADAINLFVRSWTGQPPEHNDRSMTGTRAYVTGQSPIQRFTGVSSHEINTMMHRQNPKVASVPHYEGRQQTMEWSCNQHVFMLKVDGGERVRSGRHTECGAVEVPV